MSNPPLPLINPVPLPVDKELVLKVIPMPADTNGNGDIFGGWVMAQVDLAGSVLPARHVQGRMATVAVNEFIFKQPVRVGDILSFFSSFTRIGFWKRRRKGLPVSSTPLTIRSGCRSPSRSHSVWPALKGATSCRFSSSLKSARAIRRPSTVPIPGLNESTAFGRLLASA